jgi:hypothetical protein
MSSSPQIASMKPAKLPMSPSSSDTWEASQKASLLAEIKLMKEELEKSEKAAGYHHGENMNNQRNREERRKKRRREADYESVRGGGDGIKYFLAHLLVFGLALSIVYVLMYFWIKN